MIIVRPVGGLANRMRVVAATVALAERCGTTVKCYWESNSELGANFLDLFKDSGRFAISSGNEGKLLSSYKPGLCRQILSYCWNRVRGIHYYFTAGNVENVVSGSDSSDCHLFFDMIEPLVCAGKNVCFVSGNYLADLTDVSMFEPVESIQNTINEFASVFSEHTYGLHIRRTDNTWAIEHSPISMFCEVVEKKLNEDSDAKFYLSTDDPGTVSYLHNKYNDSIIVRPKSYGRDSLDAMKDAVVDMCLLARTSAIYGSFYSSFSEMAALIGNRPLTILKAGQ